MVEEQCWRAVQDRTRDADGAFVYAVRTTQIYCRPSCPSRKPLRGNVEFFTLPEAAERAGYRACLRCKPRELPSGDPAVARVRRACAVIEAALEEDEDGAPALGELAARVETSPFHLQRLFKRHLGISPRDYADAWRLGRVKAMLRRGDGVAGALYEAGYGSSSRAIVASGYSVRSPASSTVSSVPRLTAQTPRSVAATSRRPIGLSAMVNPMRAPLPPFL